jgi:hypothetical protein
MPQTERIMRKYVAVLAAVLAAVVGATAIIGFAVMSLAAAVEQIAEPCQPGHVKTVVREAGSCLGDYKKRVANEPIAFCTIKREVCVPAAAKPPVDATVPAATEAPAIATP